MFELSSVAYALHMYSCIGHDSTVYVALCSTSVCTHVSDYTINTLPLTAHKVADIIQGLNISFGSVSKGNHGFCGVSVGDISQSVQCAAQLHA